MNQCSYAHLELVRRPPASFYTNYSYINTDGHDCFGMCFFFSFAILSPHHNRKNDKLIPVLVADHGRP